MKADLCLSKERTITAMILRSKGSPIFRRAFSSTTKRAEIHDIEVLHNRIIPRYQSLSQPALYGKALTSVGAPSSDLLSLQWPSPPRNVLMIKKDRAPAVTESLIEYAK
jgi:NADH kinase